MSKQRKEALCWENSANFDKLLISLSTFVVGFLHYSKDVKVSCTWHIIKFFEAFMVLALFLSLINYLIVQIMLEQQMENKESCLRSIARWVWYTSTILFIFTLSGVLICIVFAS